MTIEKVICELAGRDGLSLDGVGGEDVLLAEASVLQQSPAFPLVVRVLCQSWGQIRNGEGAAALVAEGIRANDSSLAVGDALDAVLATPAFLGAHAQRLRDVLLERAVERDDDCAADVAAQALDGLVRLALGNWTPKHAVLDVLSRVTEQERDIFAVRACRLVGVCFERWREPDLLAVLERLSAVAPSDAAFERGMASLLLALEEKTADRVIDGLREARRLLARAEASEEERTDAAAYGRAIDAILAFVSGAASAVIRNSVQEVTTVLKGRHAWLGRTKTGWLSPRTQAEAEWARLVNVLERAAAALERRGWLDGVAALSEVLQAYCASRSVRLFTWAANGQLEQILEPRIEASLIESDTGLIVLDEWLVRGVPEEWRAHAARLREAISHKKKSPVASGAWPRLEELIGPISSVSSEQIPAAFLDLLESRFEDRHASRVRDSVPIVDELFASIDAALESCPHYVGAPLCQCRLRQPPLET